jgi:ribosomal protein L37AE/L43A
MGKLSTPDWIREGFDSKEAYEKSAKNSKSNFGSAKSETQDFVGKGIKKKSGKEEKTFKIRICPKCKSDDVKVVLTGEEGKGAREWECRKCKWEGKNVEYKELSEDEFMIYLDEKGEEVA